MKTHKIPSSLLPDYDLDEQDSVESNNGQSGYQSNNLQSLSFLPGREEFYGPGSRSNFASSRRVQVKEPMDVTSATKQHPAAEHQGVASALLDPQDQEGPSVGALPDNLSVRRGRGLNQPGKGFQFGLRVQPVDLGTPSHSPDKVGPKSSSELRSKKFLRKAGTVTSIVPEEESIQDMLGFITKEVARQRGNALAFEKGVQEKDGDSESEDSSFQPAELERNTQLNHLLVEDDHSNPDSNDSDSEDMEPAVKSVGILDPRRRPETVLRHSKTSSFNPGVYREAKVKGVDSRKELSQIHERDEGNSVHMSSVHHDSQKNVVINSRVLATSSEDYLPPKARSVTSDFELPPELHSKKSETMNSRKADGELTGNQLPLEKKYIRQTSAAGSFDDARKAHSATSDKSSTNSVKTKKNAKSGEAGFKEFGLNSSHRTIKMNEAKGLKQLNSMLILDGDIPKTPESPLTKLLAEKETKIPPADPILLKKKAHLPQLHFGGLRHSNIETVYQPQNPASVVVVKPKIWESQQDCLTPSHTKQPGDVIKAPNTSEAVEKKEPANNPTIASASKDKPPVRKRRSSVQNDALLIGRTRERLVRGRRDVLFDNLKQNLRNHFQLPNRVKTFEFKRTMMEEQYEERSLIDFHKFEVQKFSLEKSRFLQPMTVRILTYENPLVVYVNPRIIINFLVQMVLHNLPEHLQESIKIYKELPELYDLKTPFAFDPRRPEMLQGALNRRDELVSQLKNVQRYAPEAHLEVFLVENKEAIAAMNQKRLFNLDMMKRQQQIQAALDSSELEEPMVCVAVTSLDMGLKKCFLSLKANETVAFVFQYFQTKYLKRKFGSLRKDEFVFTIELPVILDSDGLHPLSFESIPVSFDTKIRDLNGRILRMSKKAYKDENAEDSSLLSNNQNRLRCIKKYDKSYHEARKVVSALDQSAGYNSVNAKLYEVFVGKELDHNQRVIRSVLLGIDYENGYIIEDGKRSAPSESSKSFQPTFKTSYITEYNLMKEIPAIQLYIAKDPNDQPNLFVMMCDKAVQLHTKIDFIMKKVYKRHLSEDPYEGPSGPDY